LGFIKHFQNYITACVSSVSNLTNGKESRRSDILPYQSTKRHCIVRK
jgi:hypothetical protein